MLALVIMVTERLNSDLLMAGRLVNTMMLVWWRYLEHLQHWMIVVMKQHQLTEFSQSVNKMLAAF